MNNQTKIIDVLKISLSLLSRKDKIKLFLISIFSFFSSFLELGAIFSVFAFISILFNREIIKENPFLNFLWNLFNQPSYEQYVFQVAFLIAFLLVISSAIIYFIQFITIRFVGKTGDLTGKKLLRSLIFTKYEWHIKQNSTFLMTLFISHLSIWNKTVIRQIPLIISQFSLIFVPFITLIFVSPIYGLLLILISSSLVLYFLRYIRKITNQLSEKVKLSQEEVSVYIKEVIEGIKDVKISSNEKIFLNKFSNLYNSYCMNLAKASSINILPSSLIQLVSQLSVLSVGTFLVIIGLSTQNIVSVMTIAILLATKIIPSINKLGGALTNISNVAPWIFTLNDIFNSSQENEKIQVFKKRKIIKWSELKFHNVDFKYSKNSSASIKNINIKIQKGKHYGFVGKSGAGKSTIIDLFLGLLIPTKGQIKVNDISLKEIGIGNWQSSIGYVPQKPLIISSSLRENIAFGEDSNNIDNDRVLKCIKLASLEDLINNLPNGIFSYIGERGKFLSGGQAQRVAVARALYQNPSILIFDEATSFQDAENENLIKKSIQNIKSNRTILSISHNFNVIKNCDEIFVIEKGRVIEKGNYNELTKKSKYFIEMNNYIE